MALETAGYICAVKRFFCICLISLLVLNLSAIAVIFSVRQYQIRREMQERMLSDLPESALQVIALHPSEMKNLVWHHPTEFFYQGEMYDVVRREQCSDSLTVFYCLADSRETELFAFLEPFISKRTGNDPLTAHTVKAWFEIFSGIFLPDSPAIQLPLQSHDAMCWLFMNHYHAPVIARDGHPPQPRPAIS